MRRGGSGGRQEKCGIRRGISEPRTPAYQKRKRRRDTGQTSKRDRYERVRAARGSAGHRQARSIDRRSKRKSIRCDAKAWRLQASEENSQSLAELPTSSYSAERARWPTAPEP